MGTYRRQIWGRKAHIGGIIPPTYPKITKCTPAYTFTCVHPPKIITWCRRGRFTNRFFLFESPFCVEYNNVFEYDSCNC